MGQTTNIESNAAEVFKRAVDNGRAALSEHDAKLVLSAYGIPITDECVVANAEEAAAAAQELGFPVVVKACSPVLTHKSDTGLVVLGIDSVEGVERAVAQIGENAQTSDLEGYLVQQMVAGKRELIVGGLRDALFGPCVMLGLGGIYVEAVGDVVFRLAPLTDKDAHEMIGEVRAQRVFDAVRGEPAVNRDALSAVLAAVGNILVGHPEIEQIDINPLIVREGEPVAADALITLANIEEDNDS